MSYNFLLEEEPQEPEVLLPNQPNYVGPNLNQIVKMTRKRFGQAILNVFERLGGEDWLFIEAKSDPKAYLELLKKMVPSPSLGDMLSELKINLINRYGDEMQIEAIGHSSKSDPTRSPGSPGAVSNSEPGQLKETATSGNPPKLIERFEDDTQ